MPSPARRVAVALVAVLMLAGCAGGAHGGAGDATDPTEAATGSTTPVGPIVQTAPKWSVRCNDIVSQEARTNVFGSAQMPPIVRGQRELLLRPTMPAAFALEQIGGKSCTWSNGGRFHLEFDVLPAADSEWTAFAAARGIGDSTYACSHDSEFFCAFEARAGGIWVRGWDYGSGNNDAMLGLSQGVLAAAVAATPFEGWQPSDGTLTLPADCGDYLSADDVSAAFGVDAAPASNLTVAGQREILTAGLAVSGDVPCTWGPVELFRLSGGSWAWKETQKLTRVPTAIEAEPVTLEGLGEGEGAWMSCTEADAECLLDVVIGGDWLELHAVPGSGAADPRGALMDLGALVVASLRA
jgi:hypothetical protein